MTGYVTSIETLETLYGTPGRTALAKVARRLTPQYEGWIRASRFCVLATVGPDGTDASPRGDDGPVVAVADPGTLLMPDWRGNNRMDSLRNILADGRLSLMFMVPGSTNVVRVNGRGRITVDEAVRVRFERDGKLPRSVIEIAIEEVYFQCARAIRRAGLWGEGTGAAQGLPTAGDLLAEMTGGDEGGAGYDAAWTARADETLW